MNLGVYGRGKPRNARIATVTVVAGRSSSRIVRLVSCRAHGRGRHSLGGRRRRPGIRRRTRGLDGLIRELQLPAGASDSPREPRETQVAHSGALEVWQRSDLHPTESRINIMTHQINDRSIDHREGEIEAGDKRAFSPRPMLVNRLLEAQNGGIAGLPPGGWC